MHLPSPEQALAERHNHTQCHCRLQASKCVHLFEQSAVLLCAESHGELIPATEIACLETLLVSWLCFLVLESVNVFGTLHRAKAWA